MAADPTQSHVERELAAEGPLTSLCFDPAGRLLFAGGEDRTITVWELGSEKKAVLRGHDSWIGALAAAPDGSAVVSAGFDDTLCWWPAAAEAAEPLRRVRAHDGWIRALAVSPDGQWLASGGNDRVLRLWNLQDGSLVREMRGHERDIYSVCFHPGGDLVLSGDLMGRVHQWAAATGEKVRSLDASALHIYEGGQAVHYGGVRGLSVSADGRWLAAGGLHKATNPLGNVQEPLAVRFSWESGEPTVSHTVEGLANHTLWDCRFHPSGVLVGCVGGNGGHLLFWQEGEKPLHKADLPDTARGLALHPDGLRLAAAHHSRRATLVLMAPKAS